MKQGSTSLPASQTHSNVALYLHRQLEAVKSEKSQAKIADEAGLPQRNLLSMMRTGQTKLPFERLNGLAKALHVDAAHLFRMALAEYQPHVKALNDEYGKHALSRNEQELLEVWREETQNADPSIVELAGEIRELARKAFSSSGQQVETFMSATKVKA